MIAAKCADCGAYIPHGYEGCEALWHEAFYVYQIGHPADVISAKTEIHKHLLL